MFPFLTFDTSCPAHLLGLSRLPIRPRYTEVKCQPRLKISNFRTAKNELPVKVGLGPIGSSPVKFKWINFGHGQFEFESVLFSASQVRVVCSSVGRGCVAYYTRPRVVETACQVHNPSQVINGRPCAIRDVITVIFFPLTLLHTPRVNAITTPTHSLV